jgi:hypothetical protein
VTALVADEKKELDAAVAAGRLNRRRPTSCSQARSSGSPTWRTGRCPRAAARTDSSARRRRARRTDASFQVGSL